MKIRAAEIPKQEEGFSFGHNQKQNQIVTVGESTLPAATASSMAQAEHKESEEQKQKEDEKEEIHKRVSDSPPTNESESRSSNPHHEAGPNLETLAVPSSLHHSADLQGSSTKDKGGKTKNTLVGPTDKEIIVKEVKAPQMLKENRLRVSVCSSPSSEPSISVEKTFSSAPSPAFPEQGLSRPKVSSVQTLEVDKKIPKGGKTLSSVSAARTSASDGYNWRKYGQKQVKSPTSSRSYYRCTHLDCCAKKIEWCDHSGQLIEIVYKSQHSHDPPRKIDSTRESKLMPSNEPTAENSVQEHPIRALTDSDPSPSSKEPKQEAPCSADKKRQNSCNNENSEVILKEEHVNEPELKRRMKKDDLTCSESAVIPGKKSKFVVHAEGDVGISGDGYRWRKYGQKMVKGNPHPRNYYRCTSAGCPARKHIETSGDNSNAAIITYKGVHDHDMPVPKKRHGPPSAPLLAAAAPASMNNLKSTKSDSPQNQKTPTKWSVDTEGELTGEALDLGGEKAIESAQTLLSIGFEIKPC